MAGAIPCAATYLVFDVTWWMLSFPVPIYLGMAFLDIYGTARAGRRVVARREAAPIFRYVTSRFGLAYAVPIQAALEAALAVVVVPGMLGRAPADPPSMAAFCVVAAALHGYGHVCNDTL